MRIAYLDCFAGISGDMFLGALHDAGVPESLLQDATGALGLGATLKIEKADRSGISATKVLVLENGRPAEGHAHAPSENHTDHETEHSHTAAHTHSHEHSHAHPHEQGHSHSHTHGRSLTEIRALIGTANLNDGVKRMAIQAFELLGHSEAKIHNVPVDRIHFHEVGAVDAIVDIVAVCAGVHHLQIGAWHTSPLNVGGGMVHCAHGNFPVPAPATADLLRGFPTYSAHVQKELVTPTGAALLRALNPVFGQQPPMRVEAIGYGAGSRNPKGFPNVLRLSIGEEISPEAVTGPPADADQGMAGHQHQAHQHSHYESETVSVLETALDDITPQLLAWVAEKALAAGALDVMLTPVIMKKGRSGTLLTVLCNPADSSVFEQLILTETSTLGVRARQDRRICLERSHISVQTPYGQIRIKIGAQNGEERNAAPEFEDCRAAAAQYGVPLKLVLQAAIAAYRR